MREQHRTGADLVGKPTLATRRERAVARELPALDRLADVAEFVASERWAVERNGHRNFSYGRRLIRCPCSV
jgi:hypothetical protein